MFLMQYFKKMDSFSKDIMLVFLGTSLASFFNLLYQLLIAHRLTPVDFAAFNTLLSILMLISAPLSTLQTAVAKYGAEYKAHKADDKLKYLLSSLLRKSILFAVVFFLIFYFNSFHIINNLKINSYGPGYILAILIALAWLTPVVTGALQGLELFGWFTSISIIGGVFKLILAFVFVRIGWGIAGALGAFLVAVVLGIIIPLAPLRNFITSTKNEGNIKFNEIYSYLFPAALSSFLLIGLVSVDMILVRYYFTPDESGVYSLAQMVGKIFLFLPGAISIVMFPRTSGLNAKNLDTAPILKKSLFYTFIMCLGAALCYNFFPGFILKVLTGKYFPESVVLGRFFSISMTLFTLTFLLVSYFLSIRDFRFLKLLILFSFLQFMAIVLFHHSLTQVQLILCVNSLILFLLFFLLVKRR